MNTSDEPLFENFQPISTAEWEARIQADLKGADYASALISGTSDGLQRKPYYRKEDLPAWMQNAPFGLFTDKGNANRWTNRQDFLVSDPKLANQLALEALNNDISSVGFSVSGDLTAEDLQNLLQGIWLNAVPVHLTVSHNAAAMANKMAQAVQALGYTPADVQGSLCLDSAKSADFPFPKVKTRIADGTQIREQGGTTGLEIAGILAQYSDILAEHPALSEDVAVHTAVGSGYFEEIAKLRALRLLLPMVAEAYGVTTETPPVTAFTLNRNMTRVDRHTNLLRLTSEAMAAVLGGADEVSVAPFEAAETNPAFSARLSRNIQHLLAHETHLDYVDDPAAGSYYLETLTDQLAAKAWQYFQQMETLGGWAKAQTWINEQIAAAALAEQTAVLNGTRTLLGVNAFPNAKEALNFTTPASDDRLSTPFEQLRAGLVAKGNMPHVLLLRFGTPAMASARSIFASNFFGCAGLQIEESPFFATVEDAMHFAVENPTNFLVFCAADADYEALSPEVLAAAGKSAQTVTVAGWPAQAEALAAQGVQWFLRAGKGGAPLGIRMAEGAKTTTGLFETLQTMLG